MTNSLLSFALRTDDTDLASGHIATTFAEDDGHEPPLLACFDLIDSTGRTIPDDQSVGQLLTGTMRADLRAAAGGCDRPVPLEIVIGHSVIWHAEVRQNGTQTTVFARPMEDIETFESMRDLDQIRLRDALTDGQRDALAQHMKAIR